MKWASVLMSNEGILQQPDRLSTPASPPEDGVTTRSPFPASQEDRNVLLALIIDVLPDPEQPQRPEAPLSLLTVRSCSLDRFSDNPTKEPKYIIPTIV